MFRFPPISHFIDKCPNQTIASCYPIADDNYPPGFNGHFPGEDDDIDAIDFGGDVYNETLQWLQRNPDEFTTDAKQLFRAMGGNEKFYLKDEDGYYELHYIFDKIRQAIKDFDQQ